jgi:hypothetical protein
VKYAVKFIPVGRHNGPSGSLSKCARTKKPHVAFPDAIGQVIDFGSLPKVGCAIFVPRGTPDEVIRAIRPKLLRNIRWIDNRNDDVSGSSTCALTEQYLVQEIRSSAGRNWRLRFGIIYWLGWASHRFESACELIPSPKRIRESIARSLSGAFRLGYLGACRADQRSLPAGCS